VIARWVAPSDLPLKLTALELSAGERAGELRLLVTKAGHPLRGQALHFARVNERDETLSRIQSALWRLQGAQVARELRLDLFAGSVRDAVLRAARAPVPGGGGGGGAVKCADAYQWVRASSPPPNAVRSIDRFHVIRSSKHAEIGKVRRRARGAAPTAVCVAAE
jgi:hypothetical protein